MNAKKAIYLTEDQDIISQLDTIHLTGHDIEDEKKKLAVQKLQIQASLRTRKNLSDADRSTTRFSYVIFFFTVVQIFIGIFQFVFDATTSEHRVVGIVLMGIFAVIICIIIYIFNKEPVE